MILNWQAPGRVGDARKRLSADASRDRQRLPLLADVARVGQAHERLSDK
jgi:hypothetical protein